MPNTVLTVAESHLSPMAWVRLQIPGRSPPAFLKIAGDELGGNFRAVGTNVGLPAWPNPISKYRGDIEKTARQMGVAKADFDAFMKFFEHGSGENAGLSSKLGTFLAVADTSENAMKLAKFAFQFRKAGYSVANTAAALTVVVGLQSPRALAVIDNVVRGGATYQSLLSKAGGVRNGLAVFVTSVSVWNSLQDRRYGQAASDTYKTFMSLALPTRVAWVAAIDALQVLMPGVDARSSSLFKVLRAIDPIGLGGVGVESMVFVAQAVHDKVAGRPFDDKRLSDLVARIKTGPGAIFAELGERIPIGEVAYDISQMSAQDWKNLGAKTFDDLANSLRNWNK